MTEREIIEFRHLASNATLAKLFDEEERRLVSQVIGASRATDAELRNAAIALEVLTSFRRKIHLNAQRAHEEDATS